MSYVGRQGGVLKIKANEGKLSDILAQNNWYIRYIAVKIETSKLTLWNANNVCVFFYTYYNYRRTFSFLWKYQSIFLNQPYLVRFERTSELKYRPSPKKCKSELSFRAQLGLIYTVRCWLHNYSWQLRHTRVYITM